MSARTRAPATPRQAMSGRVAFRRAGIGGTFLTTPHAHLEDADLRCGCGGGTMERDGWHPDPFGTHEHRYFSRGEPTSLVSDGGATGTDPIPGPEERQTQGPDGVVPVAGEHDPGPPLGWYDDPLGLGLRFWDGATWTEFVASARVTIEPLAPVGDVDLLTPSVVDEEQPSGQPALSSPSEAGSYAQAGLSWQLATTDVAEKLNGAEPWSGGWQPTDGDRSPSAWPPAYTKMHADHEPFQQELQSPVANHPSADEPSPPTWETTVAVTSGADDFVAAGRLPASDGLISLDAESRSTTPSLRAALSPLTEGPEAPGSGCPVTPSRPKGHKRRRSDDGVTQPPPRQSVGTVGLNPIKVRVPLEAGEVAYAQFRAHRMARVGRTAAHANNGPVRRIDKGKIVFTDRRLLFIGRTRRRFVGRRTALSVLYDTLEVEETTFVKQLMGTRLFLHCPQMRDGEFFGLRGPGNRDALSTYQKILQSRGESRPSTNGAGPTELGGAHPGPMSAVAASRRRQTSSGRAVRNVAIAVVLAIAVVVAVALYTIVATPRATTSANKASGPSGQLMPSRAPRGYHAVVAQDFLGTTVPAGWHPYQGQAGSDTAGWWDPSHITVGNGMLTLHAYEDPAHGGPNSPWVEGGIDQWPAGVLVNGEYLVRSRVSSATGVTEVALLWPDDDNWPPEIDFNESNGTNESTATLIWGTGARQHQLQARVPRVDLTQWHTWGVIVTPKTITYTLDGKRWAKMANHEQVAMHLALQQQVWACDNQSDRVCPSAATPTAVNLQVDWVVVYAPNNAPAATASPVHAP